MQKEVRILSLVSYKFLPPEMGGQRCIAFFNRYISRVTNFRCVTSKDNGDATVEGYPVITILSKSPVRYINPLYFFALRRMISSENITHLIIEHPYYGWLGILLKWFSKIKLIVHSHNIESMRFKSIGKWWWGILWHYEKITHRHANENFFITDDDREFAIKKFLLPADKCHTITYGFELTGPPLKTEREKAKKRLQSIHHIDEDDMILLFNGSLGYKPNLDAVDVILQHINPILLANDKLKYKIIICGRGLPASYNTFKAYADKNIIYAGFVDDINMYFKGADIFINPVNEGGGIKTKLVEALGYGLSVVSTKNGAIGIQHSVTGNKLYTIENTDWPGFAEAIAAADLTATIPQAFFDHFYWGNIAAKAKAVIT
jgi:glycosyltransferase involved in cell wall biosynthesis